MRRVIVFTWFSTGLLIVGCHPERRQITPTTIGTDLKGMPRGTMQPFPWPGQDIVKARPIVEATGDPNAALTSGESLAR